MFSRSFSTCSKVLQRARTIINPIDYSLNVNGPEKSCIVLATESILPDIIRSAERLYVQNPKIQIAVAGVDTVIGQRHAVSELWLDDHFQYQNETYINNDKTPLRESDGINIVVAKENWNLTNSKVTMKFQNNFKNASSGPLQVKLNLSNTFFSTGLENTLLIWDGSTQKVIKELKEVELQLPTTKLPSLDDLEDRWTPLYPEDQTPLKVTKCIGNLVKEINKKPASGFLQDNDKLMSIGSKDTQVWVKLHKKHGNVERHEIIAGGGGWGSKAGTLVVAPPAKLTVGDTMEFFMLTPDKRFQQMDTRQILSDLPSKNSINMIFECSVEQMTYSPDAPEGTKTIDGIFGGGSEQGFEFNGIKHVSAAERLRVGI